MSIITSIIEGIPLYRQWDTGLLCGSYLLSVLVICGGGMYAMMKRHEADALPPIPLRPGSRFPNAGDAALVLLFLLLLVAPSLHPAAVAAPSNAHSLTVADLVISSVIYLPLVIRYATLPPDPRRKGLGASLLGAFLVLVGMCVLLHIYELSGLFQSIISATGCNELQEPVEMLQKGDQGLQVVMSIMAIAVAPITEECCFRGLLYNCLKKHSCRIVAAVISSVLFGAIHMSLAQMLPLTLFALLLCLLYEKTHTLRTCIIAHALFNVAGVLGSLYNAP